MGGKVLAAALSLAMMGTGAAMADPVTADAARDLLFKPSGLLFYPVAPQGLPAERTAEVEAFQESLGPRQLGLFEKSGYGYYGAVAVPVAKQGAPVFSVQLHSVAAAQTAVLEDCQAQNGTACTVIGLLLPKGYEKRDLTLSAAATEGVLSTFGKGNGPRYLAYSPSTIGYAVVKGNGADAVAIDTCNEATAGRDDCVIGVIEE